MRLVQAAMTAAVMFSPQVSAAEDRCLAQVRQGAQPYVQEGDFGPMLPATSGAPADRPAITDEVEQIDRITPGGPWIALRRFPYYYQKIDAELFGDCDHLPDE